jgi:hypothetical protein
MKLERTYDLPDEDALARLRALTDYWEKKHGIAASWSGNDVALEGKVASVRVEGNVHVESGKITADVRAGFMAEKLGGRRYVESKLDDYLAPTTSLESLRARIPR